MSDGAASNVVGVRDVYDMLATHAGTVTEQIRDLGDKVDRRLDQTDTKVDAVTSRMDKIEGAISVFKWLGPVGLAGLVYGILKGAGYL
jgi:hypothetical protein